MNAVSYMRLDRIWGRRAGSQLATAAFGWLLGDSFTSHSAASPLPDAASTYPAARPSLVAPCAPTLHPPSHVSVFPPSTIRISVSRPCLSFFLFFISYSFSISIHPSFILLPLPSFTSLLCFPPFPAPSPSPPMSYLLHSSLQLFLLALIVPD